jgi:hypothetical protein
MMAILSNVHETFSTLFAKLVAALAAIGLICSASAYAGAQPHMLQASPAIGNPDFIGNPDLLVGFSAPQTFGLQAPGNPDMPSVPSFLNPTAPTFTITGVENGATGMQLFDLVFDVNLPLTFNLPTISPTDQFRSFSFTANDATGATTLNVTFSFATASGGLVTGFSAGAFNPQPDIPGFGAGVEMNFYETSLSAVTLTVNISDANGNPLNLSPIPEPETYAMMLAGLGLLGFTARRRKQQLAA